MAFLDDFQSYHSWTSDVVDNTAPDGSRLDNVPIDGTRTEYINRVPPHGSKVFPVGTIIIKEPTDGADPTMKTVFAMVKRGCGYNSSGSNGWEFFNLQLADDNSVASYSWRGFGQPNGNDSYGGEPTGPMSCNGCHAAGAANDFVMSAKMQLKVY